MTVASVELDDRYKRLRRLGAKLAHKAQWHGFQPICIAKPRMPFVACNELAIATKSIASVLSPAARSPWVPSNLCRGGTAIWARRVKQPVRWTSCSQSERGGLHCANAEVQTPEERGNFNLIFTQYTLVEKKRHSFFREGR